MTDASSSPTIAVAVELTKVAEKPAPQLKDLIAAASQRDPLSTDIQGIKMLTDKYVPKPVKTAKAADMIILNGWLVSAGDL